jgi:hypothetical protein
LAIIPFEALHKAGSIDASHKAVDCILFFSKAKKAGVAWHVLQVYSSNFN